MAQTIGPFFVEVVDVIRFALLSVFIIASWTDWQSRRVPDKLWVFPLVVGLLLFGWELYSLSSGSLLNLQSYLVPAAVSILVVIPVSFLFWVMGVFGGADFKALATIAILYPTYPRIFLIGSVHSFPLHEPYLASFALSVLSNAVLVGLLFPIGYALRNLLEGYRGPFMFIGRPIPWDVVLETPGKLLEDRIGFTRRGLDLDALRMYLEWRKTSLAAIREAPSLYRNPATLPETPATPGDGRVSSDHWEVDLPSTASTSTPPVDDPWGAETFLQSIDHNAYRTTPEALRAGLELLATRDRVWVSPGIPFIIPLTAGLVVTWVYGDILFVVLQTLGLLP